MDTSEQFNLMLDKAMLSEPEAFKEFDRTKNVQDQLQEMVSEKRAFVLSHIFDAEMDSFVTGDIDNWSMEQLWLAFVMKEKYNKVWVNGGWVKSK